MKQQTKFMQKEKGITLIALVITIIVLLILAGVALATLTGDSGILSNAEKAKEQTIAGNVKEKVQVAVQGARANGLGKITEKQVLTDELDRIVGNYEITDKTGGWIVTVGDYEAWVSKEGSIVEGDTLGSVYQDSMIGQTINYTATNENIPEDIEWVIIGQDENGNMLATTNRPLGSGTGEESFKFTTKCTAASWLTYEEDLNNYCKGIFSGIVQGKKVESRSINIDDVNKLTGFVEPEFNTYAFKNQNTNDYVNKVVNYYHPDATTENKWGKTEKTYKCDSYNYKQTDTGLKWSWEGTSWNDAEYTGTLNNLDLVLGPSDSRYTYVLANRSVFLKTSGNGALWGVGAVFSGTVSSRNLMDFAGSDSSSYRDYAITFSRAVRPVVSLPSNLQVVENEGTWKLAE